MPIYEFYCSNCHTLYNFLSRKIDTKKIPSCPECNKFELEKKISLFSISKGLSENEDVSLPNIDESKMEKVIHDLAGEADTINENDPKQVGKLMRKLYNSTGLSLGPGMEEAILRLETGEDPDKIEHELGDVIESEDPFSSSIKSTIKSIAKKSLPPNIDETLYEM